MNLARLFDVLTFVIAFAVAVALYPFAIRTLRTLRSGQVIQEELPDTHQKKAGTPTGGGILFAALAILAGLLASVAGHPGAWPSIAGLAAGGVIGVVDDVSKLRRGSIGIPARLKFPIQVVLAIPVAWLALGDASWWWLPLAVIGIVGTANAVNITDGMDGLAAGLSIIAVGATVLLLPHAPAGEKGWAWLCVEPWRRFSSSTVIRRASSWATPARWRLAAPWPRSLFSSSPNSCS